MHTAGMVDLHSMIKLVSFDDVKESVLGSLTSLSVLFFAKKYLPSAEIVQFLCW
jgi:hypothetical protein